MLVSWAPGIRYTSAVCNYAANLGIFEIDPGPAAEAFRYGTDEYILRSSVPSEL